MHLRSALILYSPSTDPPLPGKEAPGQAEVTLYQDSGYFQGRQWLWNIYWPSRDQGNSPGAHHATQRRQSSPFNWRLKFKLWANIFLSVVYKIPLLCAALSQGTVYRPQAPANAEPDRWDFVLDANWTRTTITKIMKESYSHVPTSESFSHWGDEICSPLVDIVHSFKVHLQGKSSPATENYWSWQKQGL